MPTRSDKVPYYLASIVLFDTFVLFVATAATTGSGRAWLLLTGSGNPTEGDHAWPAEAVLGGLAIAGYLLLPTMIGLAVAAATDQLVRNRRTPSRELEREIDRLIELARLSDDGAIDLRNDQAADSAGSRPPSPVG